MTSSGDSSATTDASAAAHAAGPPSPPPARMCRHGPKTTATTPAHAATIVAPVRDGPPDLGTPRIIARRGRVLRGHEGHAAGREPRMEPRAHRGDGRAARGAGGDRVAVHRPARRWRAWPSAWPASWTRSGWPPSWCPSPGAGRCCGRDRPRPGRGPPVLLLGHLDTVWPVGTIGAAAGAPRRRPLHRARLLRHEGGARHRALRPARARRPRPPAAGDRLLHAAGGGGLRPLPRAHGVGDGVGLAPCSTSSRRGRAAR